MAATIDHLRSDHEVRVLRDFTDARGITHRTGDTAILRSMGLDTSRMELWLEWECEGVRERLHFALRADTGPGNGRMREYFALGDPVVVRQSGMAPSETVTTGTTAQESTAAERLSESAATLRIRAAVQRHPSAGTHVGLVAVACPCDAAFHRPVLVHGSGVHACLRCGTVTVAHTVGDEGRYTGDAWIVYIADGVSDALHRWLARWPRVASRQSPALDWPTADRWPTSTGMSRDELFYLRADARCNTLAELAALESHGRAKQADIEFPSMRPPEALPAAQMAFAEFADAVRLTKESDLALLFAAAQPHRAASKLAVAKLLERGDAFDVMISALTSNDSAQQSAGAAMARTSTPFDPRLPGVLIDILEGMPLTASSRHPDRVEGAARCEELLLVIADQSINTPAMLTALPALQRRVARLDATLAGRIGIVIRELHGIPAPRTRPGFLP